MGAYLSEPITEKHSCDDNNDVLGYGASEMQGWRVQQEDAHNTILDFDKNSALFAVYDGHGGHEVAAYAAEKLPDLIKSLEAYKNGDISQALIDSFLAFDRTLAEKDVLAALSILKNDGNKEDSVSDDEEEEKEEVDNLCIEASMPIEDVIAKYGKKDKGKFISPNINRKKKQLGEGSSSSSGIDKLEFDDDEENLNGNEVNGVSESPSKSDSKPSDSSDIKINGDITKSDAKKEENDDSKSNSLEENVDVKKELENGIKEEVDNKSLKNGEGKPKINGDISDTKELNGEKSESENVKNESELSGEKKASKGKGTVVKGKGKAVISVVEKAAQSNKGNEKKRLSALKAQEIYTKIIQNGDEELMEEESESEEENYDTNTSGADADLDDSSAEDEGDEEEEDESEDDYDDESSDEDDFDVKKMSSGQYMREEPGFDSGCTACVALLKGNELYVANVGDSRAVVCRDGKAYDMSIDHKPEDDIEWTRIVKAGGQVTHDGRVNNGLNLSRALGDRGYKQNSSLPLEEQMISPLPDIKTLSLTEKDTYMIVACDGIWNSLSSQEACDFVTPRINKDMKLSQICEEMFMDCFAPNTMGDGTGCDNMTCIIVKFKDLSSHKAESCKRNLSTSSVEETPETKKAKCSDD